MKKIWTLTIILAMLVSLIGCGDNNIGENEEAKSFSEISDDDVSLESPIDDVVINTAEVTFAQESTERLSVEADAAKTVNYYIAARMYLDKFLQYDIESGNPDEYLKLLEDAIAAFEKVDELSTALETSAGNLESLEARADFFRNITLADPFLVTVYAAEESEAVKWAKDITERFDSAPAGKGIRTLAEQMGTDAKHAYAQLKQAQDILAGAAYDDFANTANTAYKTAMALKTAGTAAQLTLSVMTANPTTMAEAVLTGGGVLINGFNTLLEVGQTSSVIIVGEDNKLSAKLENVENALAPIGATIGLFSLSSNLARGKELLDDVPAMADSMMYIGSSLNDYLQDGKILGGTFTQAADGTISATLTDTMTIKKQWGKSSEQVEEILSAVGYTESEIDKVMEAEQIDPAPFDQFADIAVEEIDDVLVSLAASTFENEESAAGIDEQTESLEDTDVSSEDDENIEADSNQNSSIPDISELGGTYNFYVYITFGDQSAEGEVPQTIAVTGDNTLEMTDYTGYTIKGTYDSETGIAVFHDSDGTPVKVTFSRKDNGNIHAVLSTAGDGYSMNGSIDKS